MIHRRVFHPYESAFRQARTGFVKTGPVFLAGALVLFCPLSAMIAAVAQDKTAEAPDRPAASAEPATASELSVVDAIAKGRAIFERIDNSEGEIAWAELEPDVQACISAIRAQDANNPWLFYFWGRGFAIGGRRGDAIEQLQRFVETREGRNEWRSYLLLGDLFVDEFPRLAQSNYEKAVALQSDEPAVLFGLSRCAAKIGKTADAARLAERAVEADGRRSVRYLAHLGRIQLRERDFDEAERSARAAVAIARHRARNEPTSPRYAAVLDAQLQFLAETILAKLNEPAGASDVANDTARLVEVMRERAMQTQVLSRHEVLRVVEASVTRTAAAAPIKLLELYGATLADVGRFEDAAEVYRRILLAEPTNAFATEQLGRIQSGERNPSAAPPPATP